MTYVVPNDFRQATGKWWTQGIRLETTDISDADLTALIAEMSSAFDQEVDDHFEPENGATLIIPVLQGTNYPNLDVPKRIRAITSITVTYPGGSSVAIASSAYTYEAFTGDFTQIGRPSWIRAVESAWPIGYWWWGQSVTLVGDFSWPSTPDQVRQAVSLMCWEVVRPVGEYLRYAETLTMDGGMVTLPASGHFSQIPKVNQIADRFRRMSYIA